jgi:CheY-like chemotaxis protein
MASRPILVVDDDPGIREVVALVLASEGYPVVIADDGAEALRVVTQAAPERAPGCLLLDMRMPVLDGWGVARELKARGIALPIVVMTAAMDAPGWAAEIGAAAYLSKPFDLDHLLETVERVCAHGEAAPAAGSPTPRPLGRVPGLDGEHRPG